MPALFRRKGHPLVQLRRMKHSRPSTLGFEATATVPLFRFRRQQRDRSLSHAVTLLYPVLSGAARPWTRRVTDRELLLDAFFSHAKG
jgi:hypothetical protein